MNICNFPPILLGLKMKDDFHMCFHSMLSIIKSKEKILSYILITYVLIALLYLTMIVLEANNIWLFLFFHFSFLFQFQEFG